MEGGGPAGAPTRERKLGTVLFGDLLGSTALGESSISQQDWFMADIFLPFARYLSERGREDDARGLLAEVRQRVQERGAKLLERELRELERWPTTR